VVNESCGQGMELEEIANFMDFFGELEDPRIDRKKLYPLEEILFLTLSCLICGGEGWSDIELYGKLTIDKLRVFFPFKNGIPTDDTIRRLFRALNPQTFQTCLQNWYLSLTPPTSNHIAIDGKTIRGSRDPATQTRALHMVSAFCSERGIVLGQIKTDEKSNEINAIPQVLEIVSVKNAVVTIDAMGCQKQIAAQIMAQKGDYILALKGNQPTLHNQVMTFFQRHKELNYQGRGYDFVTHEEVDKGHGRVEQRRVTVCSKVGWLGQICDEWEGLSSVICVERVRFEGEKETGQTSYYVSSLASGDRTAAEIEGFIRRHWAIENSLHWVLDVSFNEDKSTIRKGYAPANISHMKRLSLNLLKHYQTTHAPKTSIKALRKQAGWDIQTLHAIINPLLMR
jgi:predicted transposase YbfD/YdcC